MFFDLVFVFSFFIITRSTARDVTAGALFHALLVLAVLWWSWVLHSVVATRVRLSEGFVPVLMTVGMASLFSFSLSLPQAFRDVRGAAGPITAAVSYAVFRLVHVLLLWHALRDSPAERWLDHEGDLPIIEGALIRLQVGPPARRPPPETSLAVDLHHHGHRRGRGPQLAVLPAQIRPRTHLPAPQTGTGLDPTQDPHTSYDVGKTVKRALTIAERRDQTG